MKKKQSLDSRIASAAKRSKSQRFSDEVIKRYEELKQKPNLKVVESR